MAAAESDQLGEGQLATRSRPWSGVLRRHSGRGPTKSRTHLINDLLCSVVVQDILPRAERTLIANGLTFLVLTVRKALHDTGREDRVAGVETLTAAA